MKNSKPTCPPLIFNVHKPAGISSQKVVGHFKRNLPKGFGKIGHIGTLDPFAHGVLPIAIAGAARLNNLFHEKLPKTYIAYGVLGKETPTGDHESEFSQIDESDYLNTVIKEFSLKFIQEQLSSKFVGEYWQSPHKYSAAKFEGKALHQWAREGVEIKKEKVRREVYAFKVLEYNFPHLKIEFKVSSGTYIRSLFSECARELGTIGYLEGLERSEIGPLKINEAIPQDDWPQEKKEGYFSKGIDLTSIIQIEKVEVSLEQAKDLERGMSIDSPGDGSLLWCQFQGKTLCLAKRIDNKIKIEINFLQMYEKLNS